MASAGRRTGARAAARPAPALLAAALLLLDAGGARAARWDPVTPEERSATASPIDKDAGAEVLFWRVWVEDKLTVAQVETIREHYLRVKVYTDAAAQNWTRHTLTLSSARVRVSGLIARSIQPDGAVAEMDPHSVSKEVVARVRGQKIKTVTFAIPGVRAGSIVELRYKEAQDDALTEYEEFPLQAEMPARSIQYYIRPMSLEGWHQRQMVFHANLEPARPTKDRYSLIEVRNVRAFHREPHMPPEGQVRAWMLVYYANEPLTTPMKFWRDKSVNGAGFFDDFARADDSMRRTARDIVEGARGPDEKLERLIAWCRREIRVAPSAEPETLRAYHINGNRDARAMLKQRAGTAFELDLLFGALARAAGLDARYVRVASRRRIYFDQEMMDLRFMPSYDIAVRVDGRWRCFDPQARRLPWNMLPRDEESQLALLCDRDSSQFIETQHSDPAQSVRSRSGELLLDEEGTLAGDVRIELSGHWNAMLHETLESASDSLAALRELMEWQGSWLELSDLRIERAAGEQGPARVAVRVRIPSHAAPSGRRMLLEPSAWWAHREPEFVASRRTWPVEFPFAWTDRDSLRIRVPAGWKCEAVSAPRPVSAPGVAEMRTDLRAQESGAVLEYRRTLEMGLGGEVVFPPSSYAALQKLFGLFQDADRTTATLVPAAGEP